MFEKLFLKAEEELNFVLLFSIVFMLTIIVGVFNYFISGGFLFYVALLSLALAYPIITYINKLDIEEISHNLTSKNLFERHSNEIGVLLTVFFAVVVGMYLMLPFSGGFNPIDSNITGYVLADGLSFDEILVNNMSVLALTFIISLLFLSGMVFILIWNASLISLHLYSLNSHILAINSGFLLIGHGVIEILAYVLAGIAASILSNKFDLVTTSSRAIKKKHMKYQIYYDVTILLVVAIMLIFLGAIIETL